MSRKGDIPAATRALIASRSGGVCEGCGEARATELHHRRYRSRGGKHEPENLLALCGSGNHSGCHGVAHTGEGERLGWSVESGQAPPYTYELVYRGVRGWLHDGEFLSVQTANERIEF